MRTRLKLRSSLGTFLLRRHVGSTLNSKGKRHFELMYAKPAPTSMRLAWLRKVGPATKVCSSGAVCLIGHRPGSSKRSGGGGSPSTKVSHGLAAGLSAITAPSLSR